MNGVASEIDQLIRELDDLSEEAHELQLDGVDAAQVQRVRNWYTDWFGRAIRLVPAELQPKFRDYYEGGKIKSRIQAYLSNPAAANALFDPSKPPNPLIPRYQYPFADAFLEGANGQRQILVETRHRESMTRSSASAAGAGEIFIVHGHDNATLETVRRAVDQMTGRQSIVLRERPNRGQTLIEKFESHAEECCFAVVLLTADDVGGAKADDLEPRARQNVVFEAGYFIGRFGRERVALLLDPSVEPPSDLSGVIYISLGGEWRIELAREMRAVNIPADLNWLS